MAARPFAIPAEVARCLAETPLWSNIVGRAEIRLIPVHATRLLLFVHNFDEIESYAVVDDVTSFLCHRDRYAKFANSITQTCIVQSSGSDMCSRMMIFARID